MVVTDRHTDTQTNAGEKILPCFRGENQRGNYMLQEKLRGCGCVGRVCGGFPGAGRRYAIRARRARVLLESQARSDDLLLLSVRRHHHRHVHIF